MLKKSVNKDRDGKVVNEKIVEFANRGYRALGVSRCDDMVRAHFPPRLLQGDLQL